MCQLNPITNDEDLELIFSRFGKIVSCEILRVRQSIFFGTASLHTKSLTHQDKVTQDSLQYAFIEYDNEKSAEQAFFKMNKVRE